MAGKRRPSVRGGHFQKQHGNHFIANACLAPFIAFSVGVVILHGPFAISEPEDSMQTADSRHSEAALPAKEAEATETDRRMELGLDVPDMPVASSSSRPDAPDCQESLRHHAPAAQIEGSGATRPQYADGDLNFSSTVFAKWLGVFGAILLLIRHSRR